MKENKVPLSKRLFTLLDKPSADKNGGTSTKHWPFAPRFRVMPAFWTISSVLSLIVNVVLIAVLIVVGREIFFLRAVVGDGVLGGLFSNFQKMDAAHIRTTIQVNETITVKDTIPVQFTLPLEQDTVVTLVEDTHVNQTTIYLNGVPVPLNLILPKGTKLGISLNLDVPVDQTIPIELEVPVHLTVPVDIPLDQTELHEPFTGLQAVVSPYYEITSDMPATWEDIPFCGPGSSWLCRWYFGSEKTNAK
jgi:hypothetical protein